MYQVRQGHIFHPSGLFLQQSVMHDLSLHALIHGWEELPENGNEEYESKNEVNDEADCEDGALPESIGTSLGVV